MLTFLRKVRRRLLTENRITRYLAYAIGEIFLVVIGIMIAIQLNNWNERSKYREDLAKALTEIERDIREDSLYMIRSRQSILRQRSSAVSLKSILPTDLPYSDSIGIMFSQVSFYYAFEIERATYESVREPLLSLMTNDSLRMAIDDYYFTMNNMKEVNLRYSMGIYWRENIYPVYFKSFSWSGSSEPVDFATLRTNPAIWVALDYVLNDSNFYLRNLNSSIEQNAMILALLREELER